MTCARLFYHRTSPPRARKSWDLGSATSWRQRDWDQGGFTAILPLAHLRSLSPLSSEISRRSHRTGHPQRGGPRGGASNATLAQTAEVAVEAKPTKTSDLRLGHRRRYPRRIARGYPQAMSSAQGWVPRREQPLREHPIHRLVYFPLFTSQAR